MSLLYGGKYDYQTKSYTFEQFLEFSNLPENKNMRFEFIYGYIYAMDSPAPNHSRIVQFIMSKLCPYLLDKKCEPFIDLGIHFKQKLRTDVLYPDIIVNCDPSRIKETHCAGTPEFILEVVSPTTYVDDYNLKKDYYLKNGAKEYWVVDHYKSQITAVTPKDTRIFTFSDTIPVGVLEDLSIDLCELSQFLESSCFAESSE